MQNLLEADTFNLFFPPSFLSSHVKETKVVLDSGFHAVDSGF